MNRVPQAINNSAYPLGSLRGNMTDDGKGSNLTKIEASILVGKNDSDEAIILQGSTKGNIVRTQEVSISYRETGLEAKATYREGV